MVEPQASRFWTAALQSGLVNVEALTPCWEAIPAEKREALEHLDRRLARQAVQQNVLTLWQAQQLLAGRTSGFRVDRYVLLDLIGHGGMGRVYLARDTRLARRVALKILALERMNNPRAIARFQREARVGAQLEHENLVRIYDFGEIHGRYFLVMEFIEGKTIGAIIAAQGFILPPAAATLARQVALGLEHVHRKGLVHRDVNPYNVLVTHEGIAKLTDLGLAIDLADEDRVTREGATVGTFDYVAPEQARHSHLADARSDIYSLGCSLYHMLTGSVPFPSPSLPEKLFAHQALEPKPIDEMVPDIAPGFVEVLRKMMRKLPEERYVTPLHVAQALEPFIEDKRRPHGENGRLGRSVPEKPAKSPQGLPSPFPSPLPSPSPSPSRVGEVQAGATAGSGLAAKVVSAVSQAPPASSSARQPVAVVHGSNQASEQPVSSGPSVANSLFLDLGPEPPLYDTMLQSKTWFRPGKSKTKSSASSVRSQSATISQAEPGPLAWLRKHWGWGLLALVALLAILGAGFALSSWLRSDPGALLNSSAAASSGRKEKFGPSKPVDSVRWESPSKPPPNEGSDLPVWGLRMQFLAGGRAGAGRRLALDHCTVSGAGLLILDGFTPLSSLDVKATGCAVKPEC